MRQVLCGGVAAALVLAPAGQALEKGKGEARKAPELKQLVGAVMPGRTRSGRRDSIRNLLTGKEVAKDTWISPDESWTCSLSGRWTVQEGEEGGAPFVALIPAGEAQPQRAMFAFPGALTPARTGFGSRSASGPSEGPGGDGIAFLISSLSAGPIPRRQDGG